VPTAKAKVHPPHLVLLPGGNAAQESKYEILFDQASDAILTIHREGKRSGVIDAANQAMENLTGYLKSELIGQPIRLLAPPTKGHAPSNGGRPLSEELFSTQGTYEDISVLRKDGYIRHVDLSVRPITGAGGTFVFVLLRDATEKKGMERDLITKHAELRNAYIQLEKKNAELQAMQEQLVQAGKMAALGELSAGIAHEINQPLQGIRGYAQELQSILGAQLPKLQDTAEVQASLAEVVSNVDKMAAIIQYLRAFTRKSAEEYRLTSVHHAIEEALKMLARQFEVRGIGIKRHFAANLPDIFANPLQLEQVFINLATNARDAIEATGRKVGEVSISTRKVGKFVEIRFKDDGCGMNERTKSKAFNPFYTTKEVGKGMGLGLSLSYGILSKLHGSIVVESEMGKGAEFVIRVPIDYREVA